MEWPQNVTYISLYLSTIIIHLNQIEESIQVGHGQFEDGKLEIPFELNG